MKRRVRQAAPDLPGPDGTRAHVRIALGIGVFVLAAHLAGASVAKSVFWGTHSYAFLPAVALPAAIIAMVAVIGYGLWRLRGVAPTPVIRLGRRHEAVERWLARAGIAGGAFVVFWGARSRQILLGDGIPLTANLPYETTLHAREPLTSLFHQQGFRLAQAASAGRDVHDVARDSVALGSTLAGVLFVFVALALATEVLRLRPAPDGDQPAPRLAMVVGLLFCLQGFVQLFFGYVENYAYETLAITAYLWLSLRYLRGAMPLLAPAAALLFAIAFNLSAVTLAVSFSFLAAAGLVVRRRRMAALRDLALFAALFVGVVFAMHAWGGHYRFDRELIALLQKGGAEATYLLSRAHSRDFLNAQMLIGPFALFWLLPVLALVLWKRGVARPAAMFLAVSGVVQALVCWMVADLPLGYARDWDLFAPFGIVLTVAAAGLALTQIREARAVTRVIVVTLAVSAFHTVPWIALNASEERSLERFKHLPLGKGRTESTVGFWYFAEGRLDDAREWLERALAADPDNVRAYGHLGNIAMAAAEYDVAASRFADAVARRPNQPLFRQALVSALIAEGRDIEALDQMAVLVQQEPARARHWAVSAVLLLGRGRVIEAREAMRHAMLLAPTDPLFADADARFDQPDGYATLLANEWPRILSH